MLENRYKMLLGVYLEALSQNIDPPNLPPPQLLKIECVYPILDKILRHIRFIIANAYIFFDFTTFVVFV